MLRASWACRCGRDSGDTRAEINESRALISFYLIRREGPDATKSIGSLKRALDSPPLSPSPAPLRTSRFSAWDTSTTRDANDVYLGTYILLPWNLSEQSWSRLLPARP